MAVALPDLIELSLLFVVFALTWLSRIIALALLGWLIDTLLTIPGVGKYIAAPFQIIEQALAYALGKVEAGIDAAMGASWHFFAHYIVWLWDEIAANAATLVEIASGSYAIVLAIRAARALAHEGARALHGIEHGVKSLVKEWHGIESRVKSLEHEIASGIGHDLRVGLKATEKELHHVENDVLPAIQSADAQAEAAISNLYDWAAGKASLIGVGTLEFAVAAALSTLGLAALSCTNFKNLLNKYGCGLGSILDGLLGLVVSGLILTNICDVLGLLETAYGDVAGPLISFLTEIPLGGCETPPDSWATLNVAAGPLPPRQRLGALPA